MTSGTGRTLSRDYKHVRRHTPGGAGQVFTGWVGLFVGLAVGLSVALAVFMHYRKQPPAQPEPTASAAPASASASEEAPPAPPPDPAKDLTFYTKLQEQEVEVPRDDAVKPGAKLSKLPKGDVTLQAGSFKQPGEAEKMQAKLAVYGIDSKIQRFSLEDETWYRVRIGPIATVEQLEAIRAKLAEAEIEATPVSTEADAPPP